MTQDSDRREFDKLNNFFSFIKKIYCQRKIKKTLSFTEIILK